jgi:ABC-type multidrug transport system fused ATPase/permease subunit
MTRPTFAAFANLRRLFRGGFIAVGPDRGRLALITVLALAAGAFETGLLFLLAAIAIAMTNSRDVMVARIDYMHFHLPAQIMVFMAGVCVIALIGLSFTLATLQSSLSARAIVRIRERVLHAYLDASLSFREMQRENYLQQLMGEYCQRAEVTVQQFANTCVMLSTIAMVVAGAVITSPKIAAVLLLGLAVSAGIAGPITRRGQIYSAAIATINRDVSSRIAQTARLTKEVIAFNVGAKIAEQLDAQIAQSAEALRKVRYQSRLAPSLYQYTTLAIIVVILAGLTTFSSGPHAGLAPLALLMVRALAYGRQLLNSVQSGSEAAPYIETLEYELKVLDANRVTQAGMSWLPFEGLSLDRVEFSYKSDSPVLQDISFELNPGEMLGIVGPSGSGKSTLCGILLRLRSPTGGTIRTGGLELSEVSPAAWSGLSAFVPQESELIHGTVAENIRFFRDVYDNANVERAARAAHIYDEIMELPEGFDTLVGPGARGLSGGQRQRLAIARALLGSPQLLILDEPTSALDQLSERLIGQTLEELKGSVSIVLIAHRPATLRVCDRILRVEDGRLFAENLSP